jgi:hypothetical protein
MSSRLLWLTVDGEEVKVDEVNDRGVVDRSQLGHAQEHEIREVAHDRDVSNRRQTDLEELEVTEASQTADVRDVGVVEREATELGQAGDRTDVVDPRPFNVAAHVQSL